jgi:hypothetical protein
MKISDRLLFEQTRSIALAIALLCFAGAGCVSHRAEMRQESGSSTGQAAALIAKARHTQNTGARIGLTLAAADEASQGIAEGNAPEARTLYNTACAELAVLLKKSSSPRTLPATFATPAGSYVLKFDTAREAGRWEPSYFTKLLTPAELKNKAFVSKQPPAGIRRSACLRIPARCCFPGSECPHPSRSYSTFPNRRRQASQHRQPSHFMIPPRIALRELRAKTVHWLPI